MIASYCITMAKTVEFKESSTLPRRWLDFMKCGSVHELPFLSSSMPSIPQDLPRDQGKGNHGVDCCKEVNYRCAARERGGWNIMLQKVW